MEGSDMAYGYEEQSETVDSKPGGVLMDTIEKLSAAIDRLEGQRNHLHGRLEPVLGPHDVPTSNATASELNVVSPYSDVTRRIQDATQRVDLVATSLAGLLDRLEV